MTDTSVAETATPLSKFTADTVPLDIATELNMAREVLAETDPANIHDPSDMIGAATSLSIRLRTLVAAVERGEDQ
ncbi:hypothetical protein ACIQVK_21545 [Streptomyces sp. NPDC090493]|uniref:hypothetical protein n=1 Tax=Streptomyces sp. NPDC090493 TaxID=3365964 RepID=UPI00380D0E31